MYYCKYPYIIYRDYPDFGYLTDNRNFGYDTASKSGVKVGDRIVSKTGSVFYSVLTDKPQSLGDLVMQLSIIYPGVSLSEIKSDAMSFYRELSRDGFVYECSSLNSLIQFPTFSYQNTKPWNLKGTEEDVWEDNPQIAAWESDYRLSRLHIEVSGLCNEHCVHCYFPDQYGRSIMTKELFLDVLEQCRACNVLNITISGGEPMINPNLQFFISECRKNNLSINVLSNLTLLTESLLQEFKITPLLSIQTSLYSMNGEIHDSITNLRGSFLRTKKAIEILHENNIPMQINCPIMKQNRDGYNEVLDWARSLNIEASRDYMIFGCIDGSGKNLKCRLDIPELEQIIRGEALAQSGESEIGVQKQNIGPTKKSSICPVCANSLCVSNSGDVYPCEGWQSFVLGNIRQASLATIWEKSSDIQTLRNLTYDDFPKCRSCEDRDYCSICLIRNANESNAHDYKEVNPYFCSVARVKRRSAECDSLNKEE